ncbi:short-chain dehydrogenase [Bacillus sp. FJAT-27264]|uniref:SDR family oxidoreductase n=1 Tax=Paenibacillus sp. (strain DSM 101736 / FJAT-27264) TaxID=1850362 RepID=UPI000807B670|nr:SDR family oxidoreductase [Bacillus sp. FJAT-27264]OBZ14674.1 short-chain dehydrogenase [Bacillus sp. FJAT-27264]
MTPYQERSKEKVVLITGSSSGFGLLTAITLAKKGFKVAATMRDLSRSSELEQQARQEGVLDRMYFIHMDVTDQGSIDMAVAKVIATFGRIDVLVNNAGYAVGGFVEEVTMDDWRGQIETNLFGLIAVTKAVLPLMRGQESGTIINVGSISGLSGFPGYAPYAASKFAVEGFSESLRHEMSPFGIKVVIVEPGSFRTAIWGKGLDSITTSPDSPYKERLDAVLSYTRKTAESAPDPQQVADLIGRIAGLSSPRLRYPIGKGTRILRWGKTLLPWKWLEKIIDKSLKK